MTLHVRAAVSAVAFEGSQTGVAAAEAMVTVALVGGSVTDAAVVARAVGDVPAMDAAACSVVRALVEDSWVALGSVDYLAYRAAGAADVEVGAEDKAEHIQVVEEPRAEAASAAAASVRRLEGCKREGWACMHS